MKYEKCIWGDINEKRFIINGPNNLLRKKDEQGNNIGGFIDPVKRNVTAIRLRGEQSDGLFLPIKSLESFVDISKLKEGDSISVLNRVIICEKY